MMALKTGLFKGHSDVYGARAIARIVRTKVSLVGMGLLVIRRPRVTPRFCSHWLKNTERDDTASSTRNRTHRIADSYARDGDVVAIRASADDEDLMIEDNHPLGTPTQSKQAVPEAAALDLKEALTVPYNSKSTTTTTHICNRKCFPSPCYTRPLAAALFFACHWSLTGAATEQP